jgi:hypothetical protein
VPAPIHRRRVPGVRSQPRRIELHTTLVALVVRGVARLSGFGTQQAPLQSNRQPSRRPDGGTGSPTVIYRGECHPSMPPFSQFSSATSSSRTFRPSNGTSEGPPHLWFPVPPVFLPQLGLILEVGTGSASLLAGPDRLAVRIDSSAKSLDQERNPIAAVAIVGWELGIEAPRMVSYTATMT